MTESLSLTLLRSCSILFFMFPSHLLNILLCVCIQRPPSIRRSRTTVLFLLPAFRPVQQERFQTRASRSKNKRRMRDPSQPVSSPVWGVDLAENRSGPSLESSLNSSWLSFVAGSNLARQDIGGTILRGYIGPLRRNCIAMWRRRSCDVRIVGRR